MNERIEIKSKSQESGALRCHIMLLPNWAGQKFIGAFTRRHVLCVSLALASSTLSGQALLHFNGEKSTLHYQKTTKFQ